MKSYPITMAAITDISDMLHPHPAGRRMPMQGFDEEFVDIVDYIIRITDRIWHERKVGLCLNYYADDSVIHTLTGNIVGASVVEQNTHDTLAAFPDRTLDGDNVIWSGDEKQGFYSSHLITSRMTNLGDTEYGPATGKRARIRTVADCICKENLIVEEWLARDNAALVKQLGFSLPDIAMQQAKSDQQTGNNLIEILSDWREDVTALPLHSGAFPEPETQPEAFAQAVLSEIWMHHKTDLLPTAYDFRMDAHMTAGRSLYGTLEYKEYLDALHTSLSDVQISIDHIADIPYLGTARDIAVRWSLSGTHSGDGLFGPTSNAPIYIMGITHWRIINGRIKNEVTVFDELAVRRQIAAHMLT